MFLITTANEPTWKIDEKVLFLGEWCKLHSRRSVWSDLYYEIIPYHWRDRKKMYQDFQYLDTVYEIFLEDLVQNLNRFHQCNHSLRYWKIFVGPWLHYFIEILYDRFLSIRSAIDLKQVTSTWILKSDDKLWTPKNLDHFRDYYVSDQWNHYIYGKLIKELGELPYSEIVQETESQENYHIQNTKRGVKQLIKRTIKKIIPDQNNGVVFVSSYLKPRELLQIHLSLKQIPFLIDPQIGNLSIIPDLEERKKIKFEKFSNQFEEVLGTLLPLQIPMAYIEGYSSLRKQSLHSFPKNPKFIFTANAFQSNEAFKVWTAEKVEQGTKLLIGQHGGHYGVALQFRAEDHQIAISDRFYTWGWSSPREEKVHPISGGPLIYAKKNLSTMSPDGNILCVLASLPRYFYHVSSMPQATTYLDYIQHQIVFGQNLSKQLLKILKFRLDTSGKYGWDVKGRFEEQGFGDNIDNSVLSLIDRLKECRLCVATHNATVYLETFAANFPTLIFWNPDFYELRSSAQPYFDELRRVGILHDTPQAAAAKLNEIYEDPMSWWMQSEIQEVKDEFCAQFARIKEDWVNEWKQELKS